MIKLCIDCDNLIEEDGLRLCKRENAGFDINPVDGSLSSNEERHHPVYELAFLERQADFRCGTEARFFVEKTTKAVDADEFRSLLIKTAAETMRSVGYLDCTEERILTNKLYKHFFAGFLRNTKIAGVKKYNLAENNVIDKLMDECND